MNAPVEPGSIGILRGPSRDGFGVDIVSPQLADPPTRGDFVVVPHGDDALVLRIAASAPIGSFSDSSDRGADYLAQLARTHEPVPERVRDLLLRFRVQARVLGWVRSRGAWRFDAGARDTQLFGAPVFRPNADLLRFLVNVGLEQEQPEDRVRIGVFARGHEIRPDVPVAFSIGRLKGKRTFVFARAGYGKSNLVKLLLSRLYAAPPDMGLLIVDPEGEYAPGLLEDRSLRDRVALWTDRNPASFPSTDRIAGRIRLDFTNLTPEEFLAAFVGDDKQGQVWANQLRAGGNEGWSELVRLLRDRRYEADDQEIGHCLRVRVKRSNDVSCQAIRNNIIPVLDRLDSPEHDLLRSVAARLRGTTGPPGVALLDVSVVAPTDADAVVRVLLRRLFDKRVRAVANGPSAFGGVLLVLEEAQNVLGSREIDDQDIYVRWVKEGRKYGLGALLITQQPGALSPRIVSQGDNFFVMHLLAQRDLAVLGAANAHYTQEILDFLRDEPVRGNCYFWSAPDQPYVVSARIDPYEHRQSVAAARPMSSAYADRLRDAVHQAVCHHPRVYLFRVGTLDGRAVTGLVAAAFKYLRANLPEAAVVGLSQERPGDWEEAWGQTVLGWDALAEALTALGLAGDPLRAPGHVHGRERDMVILRAARLESETRKPIRDPVDLRSSSVPVGRSAVSKSS